MNKFWIGASATAFVLAVLYRLLATFVIQEPAISLGLVDAFCVITGAMLFVLSAYSYILEKYRDTAEMLPLFSGIVWTVIVSGYIILRYLPKYQTALSILVTALFVGMGWWIQAITTAANTRRSHTLNIIMASRTSSEYQQQMRNSGLLYRANIIPQELAEWRLNPNKDEFKDIEVPKEIDEAINGTVYILNYFEFLAQGIKFRDLDDCLLRECFMGILAGIERRGFHLIIEAQKADPRAFEGVIRLAKDWNNESVVEKYRANPTGAPLSPSYPDTEGVKKIVNAKKTKREQEAAPAPPAAPPETPGTEAQPGEEDGKK